MKTFLFAASCLLSQSLLAQSTEPQSEAYVVQYLISRDGSITSTEMPLDTETGNFVSIPLEGLAALFELWVYPLIGENGNEPIAELTDSKVVGILPTINIEFDGRDSHPTPRTRVDWEHQVTVKISEPVAQEIDGVPTPQFLKNFLIRKRFLPEAYLTSVDRDEHWIEVDSLPLEHTQANQIETFTDNAVPANATDANKWSGILEYQVVLAETPENPISLLRLASMQVRVWPRWSAEFVNFPTEPVTTIPDDLAVNVTDIYPGALKVELEYLHDETSKSSFASNEPVVFFSEPWTAIVTQDRQYPITALANVEEKGDYRVRIATHYPWGIEYDADVLTAPDSVGGNDHMLPGDIEVIDNAIRFQGSIQSLN